MRAVDLRNHTKPRLGELHQRAHPFALTAGKQRVDQRASVELDDTVLVHPRANAIDHLEGNASRLLPALNDVEDAVRAAGGAKIRSDGRTDEDVPREERTESVALPNPRQERRKPLLPQVDVGPTLRARLCVQQ